MGKSPCGTLLPINNFLFNKWFDPQEMTIFKIQHSELSSPKFVFDTHLITKKNKVIRMMKHRINSSKI